MNLEAKWNLDFHKALKGLINYCHCHVNSRVKAKKTLSGNECPQKSAKQFSPYFPFLASCLYKGEKESRLHTSKFSLTSVIDNVHMLMCMNAKFSLTSFSLTSFIFWCERINKFSLTNFHCSQQYNYTVDEKKITTTRRQFRSSVSLI